mmetsp:Transcript_22165/g.78996  ORF Transcript_22165/g.78996 Transcript_22165/m.78996 type:complete len:337 (-) Transcript_22165:187-1197(-)
MFGHERFRFKAELRCLGSPARTTSWNDRSRSNPSEPRSGHANPGRSRFRISAAAAVSKGGHVRAPVRRGARISARRFGAAVRGRPRVLRLPLRLPLGLRRGGADGVLPSLPRRMRLRARKVAQGQRLRGLPRRGRLRRRRRRRFEGQRAALPVDVFLVRGVGVVHPALGYALRVRRGGGGGDARARFLGEHRRAQGRRAVPDVGRLLVVRRDGFVRPGLGHAVPAVAGADDEAHARTDQAEIGGHLLVDCERRRPRPGRLCLLRPRRRRLWPPRLEIPNKAARGGRRGGYREARAGRRNQVARQGPPLSRLFRRLRRAAHPRRRCRGAREGALALP